MLNNRSKWIFGCILCLNLSFSQTPRYFGPSATEESLQWNKIHILSCLEDSLTPFKKMHRVFPEVYLIEFEKKEVVLIAKNSEHYPILGHSYSKKSPKFINGWTQLYHWVLHLGEKIFLKPQSKKSQTNPKRTIASRKGTMGAA